MEALPDDVRRDERELALLLQSHERAEPDVLQPRFAEPVHLVGEIDVELAENLVLMPDFEHVRNHRDCALEEPDEPHGVRADHPDLPVVVGTEEDERYDDEESESEVFFEEDYYVDESLHEQWVAGGGVFTPPAAQYLLLLIRTLL